MYYYQPNTPPKPKGWDLGWAGQGAQRSKYGGAADGPVNWWEIGYGFRAEASDLWKYIKSMTLVCSKTGWGPQKQCANYVDCQNYGLEWVVEKKKSQGNFSPYRQPSNLVQVRVLRRCSEPDSCPLESKKQVDDNDHPSGGEVTFAILLEMACDNKEDVAHRKPGPPKERKAQDVDNDVKVQTPLLSHPRAIIVDDSADCHQPIASLQPTRAGLSTSSVASTVASVPLDR
ncbi:hypothetical protein EI94DRAFT_1699554 [Lactarius quietus]|nr:hypothetical protein EI94DRAFT_1699554 [Lactarius quietus]